MGRLALWAATAAVACLAFLGVGGVYAAPSAPHANHSGSKHQGRPETHFSRYSHHVPISAGPGQTAHGFAFIKGIGSKRAGAHSQVSVVSRGLTPGQNYTLQTDTGRRCGTGTTETVASLTSAANHTHGRVQTAPTDIHSVALKTAAGQVVACGTVRHHKPPA